MKCDLHVHSQHSGMCSTPLVGRICRESYSQPDRIYAALKKRGMDLVTLTDHDSIGAAESLRHRPDFFISEEVTCVMPSGSIAHIGIYDITDRQHAGNSAPASRPGRSARLHHRTAPAVYDQSYVFVPHGAPPSRRFPAVRGIFPRSGDAQRADASGPQPLRRRASPSAGGKRDWAAATRTRYLLQARPTPK